MRPWAHFTVPLPGGTGRLVNALDAEQVQPDGRADDVGDAVERPDLVEVDLLDRHPVGGRLGLGQLAEDRCRARSRCAVGQAPAAMIASTSGRKR